jgi:hypothetical protein
VDVGVFAGDHGDAFLLVDSRHVAGGAASVVRRHRFGARSQPAGGASDHLAARHVGHEGVAAVDGGGHVSRRVAHSERWVVGSSWVVRG